MASIHVTYYLKHPDKRRNPFSIGPNITFVNGCFTKVIDEARLASVDAYMARYGAFRTPPKQEEADGRDEVQSDRNEPDGQGEVPGEVGEGGRTAEPAPADGVEDGEADEGDTGAEADEGETSGAAPAGFEPVKRRTKAEQEAGLDPVQAAEFRASGLGDAMAWFKANYPEEYALAHDDLA